MKKILIIAAVVASAVMANAATFSWKTSTSNYIYLHDSATKAGSMTAYLFDVSTVTRDALVEAITSGSKSITDFENLSFNTTAANGSLATAKTFTVEPVEGKTGITAYIALLDTDGNIFVSKEVSGNYQATATTPLQFATSAASKLAAEEFNGAVATNGGWYSAAAVPEPTSGLLMLLGLAGLALRRRRA